MVPQLFDMAGRESLRSEDDATALRQVRCAALVHLLRCAGAPAAGVRCCARCADSQGRRPDRVCTPACTQLQQGKVQAAAGLGLPSKLGVPSRSHFCPCQPPFTDGLSGAPGLPRSVTQH